MVAQNIFFGVISAMVGVSAIKMVTTRNIVHAALYLVSVLGGLAALYIILAAEFVATTQFLVYIGAVMVLFLFGIMLTKAPMGHRAGLTSPQWPMGLFVAVVFGAVIVYTIIDQFGSDKLSENPTIFRSADVGDSIFSTYLVPFEAVSVLLLAALIGAIVLARKD